VVKRSMKNIQVIPKSVGFSVNGIDDGKVWGVSGVLHFLMDDGPIYHFEMPDSEYSREVEEAVYKTEWFKELAHATMNR